MKRLRAFDPLTFLDVTQTPSIRPEGGARCLLLASSRSSLRRNGGPVGYRVGSPPLKDSAAQVIGGSFTTPWGEDDRRDAGTPLACA